MPKQKDKDIQPIPDDFENVAASMVKTAPLKERKMRYIKVTVSDEDEALDIPSVSDLNYEEYSQYVEQELFFIDHHDILRSNFGQYPIACNKDQIDSLIEYLVKAKRRFPD